MSIKHLVITGLSILSILASGCSRHESKNPSPESTPKAEDPVPNNNPEIDPAGEETVPDKGTHEEATPSTPASTPTPSTPAVPSVPVPPPPVPRPSATPAPTSQDEDFENAADNEWLFKALAAERFSIKVLDASAILTVIEKNLELAFYEGQIDSIGNIAQKMKAGGGAYCNVVVTPDFDKRSLRDGIELPVHSIKETVTEPESTSILINIPEHHMAIGCIKLPVQPFKLKEVRRGLKGVFSIKLKR